MVRAAARAGLLDVRPGCGQLSGHALLLPWVSFLPVDATRRMLFLGGPAPAGLL
jgi:hypothetical protein